MNMLMPIVGEEEEEEKKNKNREEQVLNEIEQRILDRKNI